MMNPTQMTAGRVSAVAWLLGFSLWGGGTLLMADEGMWLFNDLPVKYLQEKYDFSPTPDWANHLMKASVRFNSGGSASFVSSQGLVLTNHHVGADTLYKISTPEHNYYRDGFFAQTYGGRDQGSRPGAEPADLD